MTASFTITRFIFQRALAFIYFIGFIIAFHQYLPLVGENGLYPISLFYERVGFFRYPSLFWFLPNDGFILSCIVLGVALSLFTLSSYSEKFGPYVSGGAWFSLWLLYQSIVNSGQLFYGYGWETLLLEMGFLAIFMGCEKTPPSKLFIWLYRWTLFRLMFGAGLIKIRGDECWLDLTCMVYHYETQPVPGPLSWFFDAMPLWFHKLEVLFTHFVELIVPFFYFFTGWFAVIAGILTTLFQGTLIASGNLSWLNFITVVLCIVCFEDSFWKRLCPRFKVPVYSVTKRRQIVVFGITSLIVVLSVPPAVNLFSPRQLMNASFDPLHIVNTYGAFGSITKERREIIIEGTSEERITKSTQWEPYEFNCKPGDISAKPCVMSPYHYRIDWQMWFAAMGPYWRNPWLLHFVAKLLAGDEQALSLIKENPFKESLPKFIRGSYYLYEFTSLEERKETGNWWKRKPLGVYFPPLSLSDPAFQDLIRNQGWPLPAEKS